MSLTIGLTFDLRSEYLAAGYSEQDVAEFDSGETIDAIESAIAALGYRTDRIGHARALIARLAAGDRWDLVFNVAEGLSDSGRCREAQVPAILEACGVPYTASDPLVCAATLDKAVAKRLIRQAGLNTPRWAVVAGMGDLAPVRLRYPLFVKPLAEGTGKGIDHRSRVDDASSLTALCGELLGQFGQAVLVEEYLPGREFTTAILGTGDQATVLGTMEVEVLPGDANAIYSYETKEKCEQQVRYSPLADRRLRRRVEELALKCYRALECRDVGRVDVRLDALGRPSFMEVNPLPGMHPSHSDLPMIATQEGMSYVDLIGAIIRSALGRAQTRGPAVAAGAGICGVVQ